MDQSELMLCGSESAVQCRVSEVLTATLGLLAMTLAQTARARAGAKAQLPISPILCRSVKKYKGLGQTQKSTKCLLVSLTESHQCFFHVKCPWGFAASTVKCIPTVTAITSKTNYKAQGQSWAPALLQQRHCWLQLWRLALHACTAHPSVS